MGVRELHTMLVCELILKLFDKFGLQKDGNVICFLKVFQKRLISKKTSERSCEDSISPW